MTGKADLFSILLSYSDKIKSPYIEVEPFLDDLGRVAQTLALAYPDWQKWVVPREREENFWAELTTLSEEGKCQRLMDSDKIRIYLPHYYVALIENKYLSIDSDPSLPFPSEESLGIRLPESQIVMMNSGNDLLYMMEELKTSGMPVVKIIFPDGFGSGLFLTKMIPRLMTEFAVLKIQNFLSFAKNKEYAIRRLMVLLKCKESYLHTIMDKIASKPSDICTDIEGAMEFSYLFWAHISALVKSDILKKGERLNLDVAAFQSFSIIETVNGYYKALEKKRRDAELALKQVEENLAKLPYIFTMGQIIKFTDAQGQTLLGQFTSKELENWLWEKVTDSKGNEMPALFVLPGAVKGEQNFVLKDKMIPLCYRLLVEAQGQVKSAILKRWESLLLDHEKEPAMDSDKEFENFLPRMMEKHSPLLMTLLSDPRVQLISQEVEKQPGSSTSRIFSRGHLLPYSTLLLLERKHVLSEARLVLPVWYSIPFLAAIIVFFRRIFGNAENTKPYRDTDIEYKARTAKTKMEEIRITAKELGLSLTPVGNTQDDYLKELSTRWCQILDKQASENLVEDVHALARDAVRYNMKTQKNLRLTQATVSQIAWNIVNLNPTLSTLKTKDALILYLEVYILRLFENMR